MQEKGHGTLITFGSSQVKKKPTNIQTKKQKQQNQNRIMQKQKVISPHMEINQFIYTANKLTGFYMRVTLALDGLRGLS